MYSPLFAALALALLHVQSTLAAPSIKRCMSEAEIANIIAHWPKFGGHGPVLIPCSNSSSPVDETMSPSEVEGLAKRYLADERSVSGGVSVGRRCMTEAQIETIQAAWPKWAGRGPALVPCPVGDGNDEEGNEAAVGA